jgi:CubicO group peptidase (beta-lactamase class C family)
MSRTSLRANPSARTFTGWSSVTLASMMLAACGGGGGGGDSTPPPPPPPPSNVAPTATAPADMAVALPTDSASFTGTATDDSLPSGSSISYTWEYVSGPTASGGGPGATLSSTNTAATSARFSGGPGEYLFNFKASDGSLTGTDQFRVTVQANTSTYPAATTNADVGWTVSTPAAEGMDVTKLDAAKQVSEDGGGALDSDAGYIIRGGKLVYQWGAVNTRFEMKSTTKSMGGLALLLALDEGKIALADKANARLPTFGTEPMVDTTAVTTGSINDATILHLATHTAGFEKPDGDKDTPLIVPKLLYAPGTMWSYSDQGLNWLADVLTQVNAEDLNTVLKTKVFDKIGVRVGSDLVWRTNEFRVSPVSINGVNVERRELASGINATVNAMARVGLLMLRKGVWNNDQILSNAIVATASTPPAEVVALTESKIADPINYPKATTNYGILWWTNASGEMPNVPKDAYWAWGLHETFIIVVPSLDLVIARAGNAGWTPGNGEAWNADYSVLEPFLTPIVQSVTP